MSDRWIRQAERGNPFTLRLILWIAKYAGRSVARMLLYPITLYFFLAAKEQRRASRSYLARLWGRPPRFWHVMQHIHCFAATILDRVYLLTDRHEQLDIRIHSAELVLDLAAARKGAILLGSHVGSFEVLRSLAINRKHLPLKILMDAGHNLMLTRLLSGLNSQISDTLIRPGRIETPLRVNEALSSGCLVGMLGDRVTDGDKLIRCRFLGADVGFPAGPALLASATKVPVILFLGLYRGGNRYDIYFEPLECLADLSRREREAGIQRWMQAYADRLDHYLRQAPYNWFNFYDFWNEI